MKTTLKIDIPSREQNLAGLDPREIHKPLAAAERAFADTKQLLERRKRELAVAEQTAVDLPARVNRGELAASALTDALRARDGAVLLVEDAQAAVTKAREVLVREHATACGAVDRELLRRIESLNRVADQVDPVIDEIGALQQALLNAQTANHTRKLVGVQP